MAPSSIGYYLVGNLPKVRLSLMQLHRVLLQLLLRSFWLCVLTPSPAAEQVLALANLLSFARVLSRNCPDPESHSEFAEPVIDFVVKFILEKLETRQHFCVFRAVLRKVELADKYRAEIDQAKGRFEQPQFIHNFEEVPFRSSDKRQLELAVRKEARLVTEQVLVPSLPKSPKKTQLAKSPSAGQRLCAKTPEKKILRSARKEEYFFGNPGRLRSW